MPARFSFGAHGASTFDETDVQLHSIGVGSLLTHLLTIPFSSRSPKYVNPRPGAHVEELLIVSPKLFVDCHFVSFLNDRRL